MLHNIPVALSFLIMGLLIIAVSVPLVQGKVRRNRFYGIRTPKAFESDELWFKINRYGGQQLLGCGVVLVIFGVATSSWPQVTDQKRLTLWFGEMTLVILVPSIVRILLYSKRL